MIRVFSRYAWYTLGNRQKCGLLEYRWQAIINQKIWVLYSSSPVLFLRPFFPRHSGMKHLVEKRTKKDKAKKCSSPTCRRTPAFLPLLRTRVSFHKVVVNFILELQGRRARTARPTRACVAARRLAARRGAVFVLDLFSFFFVSRQKRTRDDHEQISLSSKKFWPSAVQCSIFFFRPFCQSNALVFLTTILKTYLLGATSSSSTMRCFLSCAKVSSQT